MRILKKAAAILAILVVLAGQALATDVGYITSTYMQPKLINPNIQDAKLIEYSWASTAGGIASITLTGPLNEMVKGYYLYQVETTPSAVTGVVPTTLYDVSVRTPANLGSNGLDVTGGAVADRSATARELAQPSPYLVNDTLGVWVTNSGDITKGTIRLMFVR
jgi:hypothetical protein